MDDMIGQGANTGKGMGTLKIRKVGAFLGAEVTGIDLSEPLSDDDVAALKQAHAELGVLVFPDQKVTSEQFMDFGRRFGELSVHPFSSSTEDNPELIVYDNKEGNPPARTDIWHTDETFRDCPAHGTILCAREVPEVGGDTTFASMTAIYDSLSDRLQQFLSGLEAVHDFHTFKNLFPDTPEAKKKIFDYEQKFPKPSHPVVRVHPVTGRKALFVNPQFTLYIKGMDEDESAAILEMLYKKTHKLEFQYRHRWRKDMVVFWDNPSTQHSAVHDYYPHRRLIERITLKGEKPVGDAPPPDPETLRKYIMPPIQAFTEQRQKRQHEL